MNKLNDAIANAVVFSTFGLIILGLVLLVPACSSLINTGEGQYQGVIVETRHHGIIFETYGVHLKTGDNSSVFEDFCVLDKTLFDKISAIDKDQKVLISYKKKLATPVWQCDSKDSNDIMTDFKIVK